MKEHAGQSPGCPFVLATNQIVTQPITQPVTQLGTQTIAQQATQSEQIEVEHTESAIESAIDSKAHNEVPSSNDTDLFPTIPASRQFSQQPIQQITQIAESRQSMGSSNLSNKGILSTIPGHGTKQICGDAPPQQSL